jgi:TPR repeat protein
MSSESQADALFAEGQEHDRSGRCAAAARCYEQAVAMGHVPSHAPLAMMLSGPSPLTRNPHARFLTHAASGGSDERDGVPQDKARSMQLLQDGARLSCAHCKGILGGCCLFGEGVEQDLPRGSELLRESVAAASCYGQYVLALCHVHDIAHVVESEGASVEAAAECAVFVSLLNKSAAQVSASGVRPRTCRVSRPLSHTCAARASFPPSSCCAAPCTTA